MRSVHGSCGNTDTYWQFVATKSTTNPEPTLPFHRRLFSSLPACFDRRDRGGEDNDRGIGMELNTGTQELNTYYA